MSYKIKWRIKTLPEQSCTNLPLARTKGYNQVQVLSNSHKVVTNETKLCIIIY